jgi:hypothetical protein
MGIKKQNLASKAFPKHLTEIRNLVPLLKEMVGREEPELLEKMVDDHFRRGDAERITKLIKWLGLEGQLTEQTEFILEEKGASVVSLKEIAELADGEVVEDLGKIKHRCQSCGGFTTAEIRDAETGKPLCRSCALPHPFTKDAFVSPAVFELMRDDAWTRLEVRLNEWKARRTAQRLQQAETRNQDQQQKPQPKQEEDRE